MPLRETFEGILRIVVPASWIAVSVIALFPDRARLTPALVLHAGAFFSSAFVTRLAVDHHESRYQIAGFLGAAAVLEVLRTTRRSSGASLEFWAAAAIGASLGVILARPISHRYWLGPW